jgi:hypothetical protein
MSFVSKVEAGLEKTLLVSLWCRCKVAAVACTVVKTLFSLPACLGLRCLLHCGARGPEENEQDAIKQNCLAQKTGSERLIF